MLILVGKNGKAKSRNQLFLIENIREIKELKLSAKQAAYFKTELKTGRIAHTNESGAFTVLVRYENLNKPIHKENLRKAGDTIFELVKNQCADLAINGKAAAVELFAEGFSLSSYSFDKYLSDDRKPKQKLKKAYTTNNKADLDSVNSIVEATTWARNMINEPLSFLTAEQFSKEMKKVCSREGIKVEIFGKQKIESLKMGGILAVNRGSVDPPTLTTLEWKPKNAVNKKPIVLVGKGIVYDTGGVSLKPTANSMDFMKSDMGGGAAVAGAILAVAKLKLPLHVITLVPATDNRPGVNAYVPGDIITMYDGTTVEVLNTDAEGRMVLADALAYAKKFDPELVIDAATLTGAAVRAIGLFAIVAMGNAGQKELNRLNKAGMDTYDRIVELPFWDDYLEEMKSSIADLNNLGGPYAGMITAGKFLEHFTDYPYIHLDIAGPTYMHKKNGYRGKGGTGAGVRLITEFLKSKAKN